MKVTHIHLLWPIIHDYHTVGREWKSGDWDKTLNLRESRLNKMAEEKKAQISEASQFFMQSHSKENGKYVMICNGVTCAWNWAQVCHIYPV